MTALSLARQEWYRQQYRARHPDWRSSGELYEGIVRRHLYGEESSPRTDCTILDLGCGAGGVIELFSQDAKVAVGFDPDLSSLLRHRDPRVRLVAGSGEELPFPAEYFDLIISSWTLEHARAPSLLFSEVARVLKPQGHFVFLAPNASSPIAILNRLVPKLMQGTLVRWLYGRTEEDTFPTVYRANTVEIIDRLATAVGLQQVRLQTVSDPTYLAFSDTLFRLTVFLEQFLSPARYVHIVGDYVKRT
ncbi:MAG: class I SAM-dependent methyltransferase [Chloroflexota bacterium]|nr:class I SAM-dependent methyltransferase [Chloroflexota bacterium]